MSSRHWQSQTCRELSCRRLILENRGQWIGRITRLTNLHSAVRRWFSQAFKKSYCLAHFHAYLYFLGIPHNTAHSCMNMMICFESLECLTTACLNKHSSRQVLRGAAKKGRDSETYLWHTEQQHNSRALPCEFCVPKPHTGY